MAIVRKGTRTKLLLGAAIGGIAFLGAPLAAQERVVAAQGGAQASQIEERQSYALRLMMQVYNGEQDISHTQLLGVGRARSGSQSVTQFDFGDGATVTSAPDGQLAASRFLNVSPTEHRVFYDYDSKTMVSDAAIAGFHNAVVRPMLGKGPALGRDVAWEQTLALSDARIPAAQNAAVTITLSREYFTHNGMPMVLIHYAIPAFAYRDEAGNNVVHWGQGISLTDPGFGMIYLNSALHRSVVSHDGGTTPYRFARTMAAANQDGSAMVDYRAIPQLAPYIDDLFSAEAMRVVHMGGRSAGKNPLATARNLDLIALSIGEDGANEVPMASAAQFMGDQGQQVLDSSGAQAMTGAGTIFADPNTAEPGSELIMEEMVHSTQGGAPSGDPANAGDPEEEAAAAVEAMVLRGGLNTEPSGNSQADLEAAFGDPGNAQVFTGPNAQQATDGLGANAATGAGGMVFGNEPSDDPGLQTVLEEATHAGQNGGSSSGDAQGDPEEAAAQAVEQMVLDGGGNTFTTRGGGGGGGGGSGSGSGSGSGFTGGGASVNRPTAPGGTSAGDGDLAFVSPEELASLLDDVRAENADAAAALEAYQAERLAEREGQSILDGDYEMRLSTLDVAELLISEFDIDPVVFDPVTFGIPVFDEDGDLFIVNEDGTTSLRRVGPDDFEITPFDPPEISRFDPTDPDDLDGYPGTGEYPAFGFDSMSGTLNVDLAKFEDWLATQNIQQLIRLAIAAGFPYQPGDDGMATLAVALNSAEQVIRLSQDSGYRTWANQAPSCSGYVGCGPNYLGRWGQKRAIVALGDILAESREVFSTGGFSDIGISGFNLAYILRDFGIQDGDLIDVEIQQFGRTIARLDSHFLTTAGDAFSARLRPGVATMVVTALNEGSASPNTAEVTIEDVVRGDAVQTYDLNTGQTAVLRIEANATPE